MNPMPKLSWIHELFSTFDELHAFECGLFEILCPFPPKIPMSQDYQDIIKAEYHYYQGGRATGLGAWLSLGLIAWWIF